jgi:DNA-binding transcriptional LysR family regulator
MELRHLRYFVAVAEAGGFRRAAELLHVSQPPLSQQVRALEEELGVELLTRSGRGVVLSPAGEVFLRESHAILDAVARATELARRVGRGETGHLSVAFVGSSLFGLLPAILRAFRAERPDVELHLREQPTGLALDAIRAGHTDVGVLRPPSTATDLECHVIERERVLVALPQGHRLADSARIDPRELWNEQLILLGRREAPGLHESLVAALESVGGLPHVSQEASEIQTVLGLVAADLGVSLVPESAATLARAGVVYRALAGPAPTVDLALVWREDARSPVLDAFLDIARRVTDDGMIARGRPRIAAFSPHLGLTPDPTSAAEPGP